MSSSVHNMPINLKNGREGESTLGGAYCIMNCMLKKNVSASKPNQVASLNFAYYILYIVLIFLHIILGSDVNQNTA